MNETQREWLESTLSLSKNGGISGKKTETGTEAAVLLVGLGGAGADALLQIKKRVNKEIQNPNIEYLEIDTDMHTAEAVWGTECLAKTEQEFCDISVDSLQNMLNQAKEAKRAGEKCWQWLDEGVQAYADHERIGSCGIRQLGRMQLFMNIDKAIHMISSKIDRVLQKGAGRLVISVCSGISGGTGGGILLDVAYILHKIAHMKFENIIMTGYVLMPDVDEVRCNGSESHRTAWRANGYACLKELDYYTRTGDAYCQKFPNGFELNMAARPFNYVHLINSKDEVGHILRYEKILRAVTESIMMRITGHYDTCGPDILLGHPHDIYGGYYGSLGLSERKVPCTEINTLYISRVFENLDIKVFKNHPTEEQFNVSVFKDLEMSEEHIRSALYKNVTVQRPLLEVKNYKYADVWPNNAPYQAAYNWLAEFQRSVASQAVNLPVYLEEKFKEFIKRNLKDRKTGPFYLRYYVKSQTSYCLEHMLEGFRKYCVEIQVQCVAKSEELRKTMYQVFAEGANAGIFNKQRALQNYLKALNTWYRNEEHAFLYEKMVEVLEAIQFRINLYYENILQPLTDTLWQVSEICAQNVWYIQKNSRDMQIDVEKNWIIQPLEFESLHEKKSHELVEWTANTFVEYLYENLREWIGRDVDNVDDSWGTGIDIAGSLEQFIYNSHLCALHHEYIENSIYLKETLPEKYIENLIQNLCTESSLMYSLAKDGGSDRELVILYIPASARKVCDITRKFLEEKNWWQARIIESNMTDRISIIRVGTIPSLSSNAFLPDMKMAYEAREEFSDPSGIDLHLECRDILFDDDIGNESDEA